MIFCREIGMVVRFKMSSITMSAGAITVLAHGYRMRYRALKRTVFVADSSLNTACVMLASRMMKAACGKKGFSNSMVKFI